MASMLYSPAANVIVNYRPTSNRLASSDYFFAFSPTRGARFQENRRVVAATTSVCPRNPSFFFSLDLFGRSSAYSRYVLGNSARAAARQ
jgi:hypothetical protein